MDDAERKARETWGTIMKRPVGLQSPLPDHGQNVSAIQRQFDLAASATNFAETTIATALREAEARGMMRAAGIARARLFVGAERIADAIERAAKEVT